MNTFIYKVLKTVNLGETTNSPKLLLLEDRKCPSARSGTKSPQCPCHDVQGYTTQESLLAILPGTSSRKNFLCLPRNLSRNYPTGLDKFDCCSLSYACLIISWLYFAVFFFSFPFCINVLKLIKSTWISLCGVTGLSEVSMKQSAWMLIFPG